MSNPAYFAQPPPASSPGVQSSQTATFFIAGAVLAALNCFARADYNLPLFIFCYLVDGIQNEVQEVRKVYLLILSQVVDLFYVIYWGASISVFTDNLAWLHSTYVFTLVITAILMVLKFGILYKLVTSKDSLQKHVSIEGCFSNLSDFFSREKADSNNFQSANAYNQVAHAY